MSERVVLDSDRGVFVDISNARPWMQRSDLSIGDPPDKWPSEIVGGRMVVACGRAPEGPDPSRWGQSGWDRFESAVGAACEQADRRGVELWIRPSLHGMLSDAISTVSWARRTESTGVHLLVDPVGWLTESMMQDSEDHLRRISELVHGCPLLGGVLLRTGEMENPAESLRAMRGLIDAADVLVALDGAEFGLLDRA